jgi:putative component of membrane protein insertase Oxa1/YidC/SpoIIIJ protein YidD
MLKDTHIPVFGTCTFYQLIISPLTQACRFEPTVQNMLIVRRRLILRFFLGIKELSVAT